MGRPKCYASPAARQAAYRQRLDAEMVLINRQWLARWEDRVTRLQAAITQAAHAGNALARQVHRRDGDATLEQLIAWFTLHGDVDRPPSPDAGGPATAPARSALGLSQVTAPTGGQECR